MIAYSIEAAHRAKIFDAILVSTDDDEISEVAKKFGGEVPFRRPAILADDYAPTLPVMAHAIKWFQETRGPVDFACCIYPTAPFLQPQSLRAGLELLRAHSDAEFAFSITSYPSSIFRALRRTDDGRVEMFWPENELKRSQDLSEAWHDAGQFYWGRSVAFFLTNKGVFSARSYAVVLPRHLVQDIDTAEDWLTAEAMFRAVATAEGRDGI